MYHEKVFKRESGKKVLIRAYCYLDSLKGMSYTVSMALCEPRKRNFNFFSFDDYSYRALKMEARREHEMNVFLKHATAEEINQVKLELWKKLKPVI